MSDGRTRFNQCGECAEMESSESNIDAIWCNAKRRLMYVAGVRMLDTSTCPHFKPRKDEPNE